MEESEESRVAPSFPAEHGVTGAPLTETSTLSVLSVCHFLTCNGGHAKNAPALFTSVQSCLPNTKITLLL